MENWSPSAVHTEGGGNNSKSSGDHSGIDGDDSMSVIPPREALPQLPRFTIPRASRTRELLSSQPLHDRDSEKLIKTIKSSVWDQDCNIQVERILAVCNEMLEKEYADKRQMMKLENRTKHEYADSYVFKFVQDMQEAKQICKSGLTACGKLNHASCLGDGKYGVYVSRCPDVVTRVPLLPPQKEILLVVFRVMKGRLKTVTEQRGGDNVEMEPTPNFDGHVSKSFQRGRKMPQEQIFDSSLMYLYEIDLNSEEFYKQRPRQCCPHAVVALKIIRKAAPSHVKETSTHVRETPTHLREIHPGLGSQVNPVRGVIPPVVNPNSGVQVRSGSVVVEEVTVQRAESAAIPAVFKAIPNELWRGDYYNGDRFLTRVVIGSYGDECGIALPLSKMPVLSVHHHISVAKLERILPPRIFRKMPMYSRKAIANVGNLVFLHCEVRAEGPSSGALNALHSTWQRKREAGVCTFGAGTKLFLLPTSLFTHRLGISDQSYSSVLHGVFMQYTTEHPLLHGAEYDGFIKLGRSVLATRLKELEDLKQARNHIENRPKTALRFSSAERLHMFRTFSVMRKAAQNRIAGLGREPNDGTTDLSSTTHALPDAPRIASVAADLAKEKVDPSRVPALGDAGPLSPVDETSRISESSWARVMTIVSGPTGRFVHRMEPSLVAAPAANALSLPQACQEVPCPPSLSNVAVDRQSDPRSKIDPSLGLQSSIGEPAPIEPYTDAFLEQFRYTAPGMYEVLRRLQNQQSQGASDGSLTATLAKQHEGNNARLENQQGLNVGTKSMPVDSNYCDSSVASESKGTYNEDDQACASDDAVHFFRVENVKYDPSEWYEFYRKGTTMTTASPSRPSANGRPAQVTPPTEDAVPVEAGGGVVPTDVSELSGEASRNHVVFISDEEESSETDLIIDEATPSRPDFEDNECGDMPFKMGHSSSTENSRGFVHRNRPVDATIVPPLAASGDDSSDVRLLDASFSDISDDGNGASPVRGAARRMAGESDIDNIYDEISATEAVTKRVVISASSSKVLHDARNCGRMKPGLPACNERKDLSPGKTVAERQTAIFQSRNNGHRQTYGVDMRSGRSASYDARDLDGCRRSDLRERLLDGAPTSWREEGSSPRDYSEVWPSDRAHRERNHHCSDRPPRTLLMPSHLQESQSPPRRSRDSYHDDRPHPAVWAKSPSPLRERSRSPSRSDHNRIRRSSPSRDSDHRRPPVHQSSIALVGRHFHSDLDFDGGPAIVSADTLNDEHGERSIKRVSYNAVTEQPVVTLLRLPGMSADRFQEQYRPDDDESHSKRSQRNYVNGDVNEIRPVSLDKRGFFGSGFISRSLQSPGEKSNLLRSQSDDFSPRPRSDVAPDRRLIHLRSERRAGSPDTQRQRLSDFQTRDHHAFPSSALRSNPDSHDGSLEAQMQQQKTLNELEYFELPRGQSDFSDVEDRRSKKPIPERWVRSFWL